MIEFDVFRRLFHDSIRVRFDWERLGEPPVEALVARTIEDLRGWYTPWYRDGREWHHPDAEPIPVIDPEARRRESVAVLAARMREQRSPLIQLLAATYAVPRGQLILDGNHRLAAALDSGKDIAVLALSVRGALDPEINPDLRHQI